MYTFIYWLCSIYKFFSNISGMLKLCYIIAMASRPYQEPVICQHVQVLLSLGYVPDVLMIICMRFPTAPFLGAVS